MDFSLVEEGFELITDWIDEELEKSIVDQIDAVPSEWNTRLSRRCQHYGKEYVYTSKNAPNDASPLSTVPGIYYLANFLYENRTFDQIPNQAIVNEYYRNQGIASHTDAKVFGPVVVSISLNADCVMKLKHPTKYPKGVDLFLPRRSILVMRDSARWEWKHEIPKTVTYIVDGVKYVKPKDYRRLSLTYRTLA